jgi:hypothetical protein
LIHAQCCMTTAKNWLSRKQYLRKLYYSIYYANT